MSDRCWNCNHPLIECLCPVNTIVRGEGLVDMEFPRSQEAMYRAAPKLLRACLSASSFLQGLKPGDFTKEEVLNEITLAIQAATITKTV